jgi:pimeloyl-ACP methyl ester carboxylesterase
MKSRFWAALALSIALPLAAISADTVPIAPSEAPIHAPVAPSLTDSWSCQDAAGFSCGYLSVPLDRAGRVSGSLRLQVAVESGAEPDRGTLLLLTGGPGQPGRGLLTRLLPRVRHLFEHYRLVVLDQRGTGSGALDCPQAQRQMGYSDVIPLSEPAIAECATMLGPARDFYTTADSVADLDDLRRALGIESWTLDGVSYGTFVAAQYALTHPDRVRRLILDSVVPLTGATTLYVESFARIAPVLRAACAQEHCPYDPAADLERVLSSGFPSPDVFDLLITASIVDPSFTGKDFSPVLDLVHRAALGDPEPLREAIADLRTAPPVPSQYSSGLHIATICADLTDAPWGNSSAPVAGREAALDAAAARVPTDRVWPFTPQDTLRQGNAVFCRFWPPARSNARPVLATLPMPVLLLAGERDLSTPLEWAQSVAGHAPKGRLVVIAGAGHSLQGRSADADAAILDFLRG